MKLFKKGSDIHSYETRYKEEFTKEKESMHNLIKVFLCKAPTLWSNIEKEIKECLNTSVLNFVKKYKRIILYG